MGAVLRPSSFYVFNNRVTILEALAQVGDMQEFADRTQVTLVRQHMNTSEVVLLDLTDPQILSSPYFYLSPNDIIYVPLMEKGNKRSNLQNLTIFSVAFGGIATVLTVVNFISNFNNRN